MRRCTCVLKQTKYVKAVPQQVPYFPESNFTFAEGTGFGRIHQRIDVIEICLKPYLNLFLMPFHYSLLKIPEDLKNLFRKQFPTLYPILNQTRARIPWQMLFTSAIPLNHGTGRGKKFPTLSFNVAFISK